LYTWQPRYPSSPARRCRAGWRSPPGDPGQGEPLPEPRNYRLPMATFWRTFHHDGKLSPAWVRLGSALYPLDKSCIVPTTPSPAKLARKFYLCVPPCPSPLLSGFLFCEKAAGFSLLYISERWFFKRRMCNGLQEAAGYITYCKQDPNDVFPEIKLHGLVRKIGGPIEGI
jgi:hypothetical protein